MLSFGLDAGFESFPPLVNGLIHNRLFQVSLDLNKSLLVAMETVQLILGPYQTFQAQWIRIWMAVQNHFRRTYFDKFMPTCLRGSVFFIKQCMCHDYPKCLRPNPNLWEKFVSTKLFVIDLLFVLYHVLIRSSFWVTSTSESKVITMSGTG